MARRPPLIFPKPLTISDALLCRLRALPDNHVEAEVSVDADENDDSGGAVASRLMTSGESVARQLDSISKSGSTPKSVGGPIVIPKRYNYQSYFDITKSADVVAGGERAILSQQIGEPIIPSTRVEEATAGYGVINYPSSEAPLAVQFLLAGNGSSAQTFIVKPGEMYISKQRFDSIRYGLPFGWLGGGSVQLRILQSEEDLPIVQGIPEIVFHRIRVPIRAVGDNPATVSPNWPQRFPWINAFDFLGNSQKGQPLLSVSPTKTVLRLRKAALAAGARMRLLVLKSDDLDLGSDGATLDAIQTSGSWVDIQWPAIAASGFKIGGVATAEFPVTTIDSNTTRVSGDNAVMVLIDMDGTIGSGTPVDIERFGTL